MTTGAVTDDFVKEVVREITERQRISVRYSSSFSDLEDFLELTHWLLYAAKRHLKLSAVDYY